MTTQTNQIKRVGIIDDDLGLLHAMREMIDSSPEFQVVHICQSGEQALKEMPGKNIDILLVDINLPGGINGIETIQQFLAANPKPAPDIIMVTVYRDFEKVFQALQSGAVGYLIKTLEPQEILQALREVGEGGAPMSPEIARRIVHTFRKSTELVHPKNLVSLTNREHDILRLLSTGLPNKLIAAELGITTSSVSDRLKDIYRKLHVHSRTEAAAYFMRWKK